MQLGLGIDTGGTYTDAVLYCFEDEKVMAAGKALTTKNNLVEGIDNSLRQLPAELLRKVSLVSLSTTLATNACVEGKGSRGQLVLLGYDREIVQKIGTEYGLPSFNDIIIIPGCHGQQGQVVKEPDWDMLKQTVLECKSQVDAFGVVEYWGIRNPSFEQKAKQMIRELTKLPVVSAYETTMEINSLRRAATILLNACLIPLIDELIEAVKISLKDMEVNAPLMVVRGDGSLMSEEFAREHPVETLLSGPASSVVGGMKLSDTNDCIIVDMGGTTSDIAVARQGRTTLVKEGVEMGNWRTGTSAIEIKTLGLGGDSLISFDRDEKPIIGPRRAVPLSWTGYKWPGIRKELERIFAEGKKSSVSLGEFFFLMKKDVNKKFFELNSEEGRVIEALKDGPKSIEKLTQIINTRPYFINTERLESLGLVARAGFTPTDAMHITGEFDAWNSKCATLGGKILAQRLGYSLEDLTQYVKKAMEKKLFIAIAKYLLERNWKKSERRYIQDVEKILDMSFDNPYAEIKSHIKTFLPIIGIGAPVHLYLESVAQALGTRAIVPEESGVANAVGAITGSVIGEEAVMIRPNYYVSGIIGYGCHSSRNYFETQEYDSALKWARQDALKGAREQASAMGALDVQVDINSYQRKGETKENSEGLLLETVITARAIGKTYDFA
jgi:N-methylhydantoinase A/oxoprolinase/acetone carboxylase beta subunit